MGEGLAIKVGEVETEAVIARAVWELRGVEDTTGEEETPKTESEGERVEVVTEEVDTMRVRVALAVTDPTVLLLPPTGFWDSE